MLAMAGISASAETTTVTSPDGRLCVDINCHGGLLTYDVCYDGRDMMLTSCLGVVTDMGDYTQGLTQHDVRTAEIDETYTLSHGKRSIYANRCRQQTVTFANSQNQRQLTMTFRVYDDAVAFRSSSVIMLYFSFRFISSPLPSIGSCCTLVPPGQ